MKFAGLTQPATKARSRREQTGNRAPYGRIFPEILCLGDSVAGSCVSPDWLAQLLMKSLFRVDGVQIFLTR